MKLFLIAALSSLVLASTADANYVAPAPAPPELPLLPPPMDYSNMQMPATGPTMEPGPSNPQPYFPPSNEYNAAPPNDASTYEEMNPNTEPGPTQQEIFD
jgi:hypothetical protein